MIPLRTLFCLVLLLAWNGLHAQAQQAQVRASAAPYYVGIPIDIEIVVDGFEKSTEPAIDVQTPPNTSLQLLGVNPNISSSIQIVNGQVTKNERVRFVYRYRLSAQRPGTITLGPFHISQGGTLLSAKAVRFKVAKVPHSDAQRFRLVFPEGPFWVGQRIPVAIEWWLTESFAERLSGRRARIPLFEHQGWFSFDPVDRSNSRQTLSVDTQAGTLELPIVVEKRTWRGDTYLVAVAKRTMVALKSGTLEIEPAVIISEEAINWRTDFFGNRVASRVRRQQASDESRTLEFKQPPGTGRPGSYSGAIGKGFTISVSADRTVVQTGDPIKLEFEVRGDAALETVSLPDLAGSGLDPRKFKLPDGNITGVTKDGVKIFSLSVRVKSEQISEIPPIAFSWFNPGSGNYETTHTRPIALSVQTAAVVSATDVVRSKESEHSPNNQDTGAISADDDSTTVDTYRPMFSLSGAELAIETNIEQLSTSPIPWYARSAVITSAYCFGIVLVVAAVWRRRHNLLDPLLRRQRDTLAQELRKLSQCADVAEISRILRRMAAIAPAFSRGEFDAVLLDCDNLAYAPKGGDTGVDAALRDRAMTVANTIVATGP